MQTSGRAPSWRGYVGLSLGWLAILGLALLLTRRPAAQPIEILPPGTPLPTLTPAPSPTPHPLRVDVTGAVRVPGVYVLPPGSIVDDAITAAGGVVPDAQLDAVNRATALQDGMQIYVPRAGSNEAPRLINPITLPAAPAPGSPAVRLVNINEAALAELEALPGIGPTIAQRIIDERPYAAVEELLKVKGIGSATYDKLKHLITVQ